MSDIKDIRRARLDQLIRERFGSRAAFARATGKSPAYITRQLSTKRESRGVGEQLAREYEEILNLPRGWLDQEPGEQQQAEDDPVTPPPSGPDYPTLIARRLATMDEAVQFAVLNLIETFVAQLREPRTERRQGDRRRP